MLYIGLRPTLDWADAARVDERIHPAFRQKYVLWNATFTLPYAVFRQRLKAIAQQNLSRIEGVRIAPLDEIPAGAWVAPVDDDDWFAPDLARHVEAALGDDVQGVTWPSMMLEALPSKRIEKPSWRRRVRRYVRARRRIDLGYREKKGLVWTCGTNSYVMRHDGEAATSLANHTEASHRVDAAPTSYARLAATLSLHNRNVASQTSLDWGQPTISRERLVQALRRHQGLYPRVRLAPGLAWAKPYVDAVAALTQEVQVRP